MFNLHDFVIRTLSTMKNRLDEYQVRSYALSWYSKSVLTDEDALITKIINRLPKYEGDIVTFEDTLEEIANDSY